MKLRQKLVYVALGVLLILAWQLLSHVLTDSATAQSGEQSELVKRGEYLVTIMGCHDCHTPWVQGKEGPPAPDMARMLSGHPENLPHPTWTPADMQQRHAIALNGTDANCLCRSVGSQLLCEPYTG